MPMVDEALMSSMLGRLPVEMAAQLMGTQVPTTWKEVLTVPAALSTQPRSPALGPISHGKWVTNMPG